MLRWQTRLPIAFFRSCDVHWPSVVGNAPKSFQPLSHPSSSIPAMTLTGHRTAEADPENRTRG